MTKFFTSGYYNLDSWTLAHVVATFTRRFCEKFMDNSIDPKGRLFDQMYMAARSVYANIAEGNARRNTSTETEMKLTDVARASAVELADDYMQWIIERNGEIWKQTHPLRQTLERIPIEQSDMQDGEWEYQAAEKIKRQTAVFEPYINVADSCAAANAMYVLCQRLIRMLTRQIERKFDTFTQNGGFTESLTQARLAYREKEQAEADAPTCPKCGKPMVRRMIRKGSKQGQTFWGCIDYPRCDGARD